MPPKRKAAAAAQANVKRLCKGAEPEVFKFGCQWTSADVMLARYSGKEAGRSKIAGFDIDWTLTKTKSGRKFVTGSKDWQWMYDCVADKLRELHKDGFRVVFFTNQAGIEKNKITPKEFMDRVNAMCDNLDIPAYCLACTGTNHYRKPATSMWEDFVKNYNGGVAADLSKSFYVGDAAGRPKEWASGKGKDFSCSDRMFAANIGIDFYTPEEYFLKEKPVKFNWGSIDPTELLKTAKAADKKATYHSPKQELILMVGPPASGKSSFSKLYLKPHSYEIINRDTLGTAAKCLKACKEVLANGKSAVIDNTNPSSTVRGEYLQLAEDAGVPARCFLMTTDLSIAHHLNFVRMNYTDGKVRRIPDVAYNSYKKYFEEPSTDEGFTEVKKISFAPHFESKKLEAMFKQWTT